MNAIKKQTPSGFRSLADLRPLVLALAQLREAAGLGLPLPPPLRRRPQRPGAPQGRRDGGRMNAATMLEHLLPRWQAALPAEYAPEYIEGFIRPQPPRPRGLHRPRDDAASGQTRPRAEKPGGVRGLRPARRARAEA
jgi:hypothetical protein